MKKYIFSAVIITLGILSFTAQASSASVSFKKDSNGLFTITIKNSNGIKAFSLTAPQKLPYGGEVTKCPTSKIITNVVFADPDDFTPAMDASITDCQDNIQTLKISAPKDGVTSAVSETAQTAPAEQALPSTQTSGSSAGSSALKNLKYPIPELGNCSSKDSCKKYCDDSQNSDVCLAFAGQHKLMSSDEVNAAQKFIDNGMVGPNGCKGQAECDKYCSSSDNMEACVAFAEKNGMLSTQQKQDSQKVLSAIKKGIKPPACAGPKQCDTYCSSAEHMEECMNFSLAAGLVPDTQKAQMQKTLDVLKQGIKPPACRPNPPSQSEQSGQRSQQNQPDQSGQNGQGLQACDQYCSDPSHIQECVKFSVAVGNMTEQQAQSAIKTGGKGPGGCVGKDACDTFCNNPDNQDTCFNFAKDNGMISQDQLQQMQDGQKKMKDSFSSIPPEVVGCLTSTVGADVVEKMKTGSVANRSVGDAINQCFQKFSVFEGTPNGNGPGSGQGGQPNQNQNGQGQSNQEMMPWKDMCKPDANGKPTALACADGSGNFVIAAKVGSDGKPVCPEGSTAKCGNYQQQNQQGQNQRGQQQNQSGQSGQGSSGQGGSNQGQGFNPGSGQNGNGPGSKQDGQSGQNQQGQFNQGQNQSGPGGINPGNQQMPQQAGPGGCKGPEECQKYCASNPEVCKNFQPPQNQQNQQGQQGQSQSGQMQRQQQMQPQSGQPGGASLGPCGTGPGTCSGIGPDDQNPNNSGDPNQGQPGQMQPQQQQQQSPPSPPTSFLNQAQKLLGSVLNIFRQ